MMTRQLPFCTLTPVPFSSLRWENRERAFASSCLILATPLVINQSRRNISIAYSIVFTLRLSYTIRANDMGLRLVSNWYRYRALRQLQWRLFNGLLIRTIWTLLPIWVCLQCLTTRIVDVYKYVAVTDVILRLPAPFECSFQWNRIVLVPTHWMEKLL